MLQSVHKQWKYLTEGLLHQALRRFVVSISSRAARRPKACLSGLTLISIGLLVAGLYTNFTVVYDQGKVFTPFHSPPFLHSQWIDNDSGFEKEIPVLLLLHNHGHNVLTAASVRRLFQAYDTAMQTEGMADVCSKAQLGDCRILSPTQFWEHSSQELEQALDNYTTVQQQDDYIVRTMSKDTFPDGTPVFREGLLGNVKTKNVTLIGQGQEEGANETNTATAASTLTTTTASQLVSAESFMVKIDIPNVGQESLALEKRLLKRLGQLQQQFEEQNAAVVLEYFTLNAYTYEFQAAIFHDVPLVGVMFAIMVAFCSFVYYDRKNKVQSRSLIGIFSILSIAFAMASGYGLVWCIGVPFTNISLMVPFIVVGVGLDDTFIITGSYFRKAHQKDTVQRLEETMEEVGVSITLTTLTTMFAFCLGSVSSIPCIRWLCIYGAVTIGFVFLYQCTYFVAWMVLDERRVQANKRDCCFCITVSEESRDDNPRDKRTNNDTDMSSEVTDTANESFENEKNATEQRKQASCKKIERPKIFAERFMGWYADKLLKPYVKMFVLLAFTAYFAGCVYTTTQLQQQMNIEDFVAKDSYVRSFLISFQDYSSLYRSVGVYFRHVNQSDPVIQQQMLNYVNDLAELPQIGQEPNFFWLRDLDELISHPDESNFVDQIEKIGLDLQNLTFNERLDMALSLPQIQNVYGGDIVRDPETGQITASRTNVFLRGMVHHNTVRGSIRASRLL